MTNSVPTHLPPPGGAQVQLKARQTLSTEEIHLLPIGPSKQTMPSLAVSGVAKQVSAMAGTAWHSQKNIVDQWTINQDRNSWIGVAGIGWQKLSTASDSGCVALTMIAANALITKASVNYRTESDGMVHEIYVF
jgi:hypothetical protein